MNLLTLLLTFSFTTLALPPIEGGRQASMLNNDFIDVLQIESDLQSLCSSIKVSATHLITAAHCVDKFEDEKWTRVYTVGRVIPGVGEIVSISVHPKYRTSYEKLKKAYAKLAKDEINKVDDKVHREASLYDVAFIEIKRKESKRTLPYPEIISPKTKFKERKDITIAGYGSTNAYWNGEKFDFHPGTKTVRYGENSWENCHGNLFDKSAQELDNLSNNLREFLQIKATATHTIVAKMEYIELNNKAMILPGDSGSAALEKDVNGNFVVTGIASNIRTYDAGSGHSQLVIEYKGKELVNKDIGEFPKDWGLREKKDLDFPEILDELKRHNLLDEFGNPKSDVFVKRKYTRNTSGNFADLSHPDNQNFISSILTAE